MSLVILPGSYDPMTLGHLALVRRALERFDEAVVAVMVNPDKRTLFDMDTRAEIARLTLTGLPRARVVCDGGLLVDLYRRLHADAVCKGWRNERDLAYERKMDEWNRAHNPAFRTLLLRAEGEYANVSSTQVRELLRQGRRPEGLVHPAAMDCLLSHLPPARPDEGATE